MSNILEFMSVSRNMLLASMFLLIILNRESQKIYTSPQETPLTWSRLDRSSNVLFLSANILCWLVYLIKLYQDVLNISYSLQNLLSTIFWKTRPIFKCKSFGWKVRIIRQEERIYLQLICSWFIYIFCLNFVVCIVSILYKGFKCEETAFPSPSQLLFILSSKIAGNFSVIGPPYIILWNWWAHLDSLKQLPGLFYLTLLTFSINSVIFYIFWKLTISL